ncbi:MAG: hypothetical protein AAGF54_01125 [Pseudomonadota bacterium]
MSFIGTVKSNRQSMFSPISRIYKNIRLQHQHNYAMREVKKLSKHLQEDIGVFN